LRRETWAHLRAGLIALHLFIVLACALPDVGSGLNRKAWQDPTVQDEMKTWAARLSLPPAELEEGLWQAAVAFKDLRGQLLRPFAPYLDWCGTRQAWPMFVAPHRYPARLYIEIDQGSGWELVYEQYTPQADWLRPILESDRFRSVTFRLSWPNYAVSYKHFGAWVARQAARDFPDAERVRLRWYKYRSPSPEELREGRAPEGRFQPALVLDVPRGAAP
jgi:hypothetical protein